ncbi:MAG TPA: anthranilate synthase component I, partial [Rhodothermales bacterium]|nr:anthranilate synthase component I [Rhodothermales bacterium]
MTFDEFSGIANEQRMAGTTRCVVPVFKRLSADLITPVSAFLAIRRGSRYGFLLESVEGGEKLARYSFLGKDPYRIVRGFGERVEVENPRQTEGSKPVGMGANGQVQGNIFAVLQRMVSTYKQVDHPDLPRLTGGAVGYLGYDAVRLVE